MKEIVAQLERPEWWFSAVFVAMFAGLAGAFAKDLIGGLAARVSTRYDARRKAVAHLTQCRVKLLAKHPHLLVIEYIRCLIWFIGLLFGLGVYAGITISFASPELAALGEWKSLFVYSAFTVMVVLLTSLMLLLVGDARDAKVARALYIANTDPRWME